MEKPKYEEVQEEHVVHTHYIEATDQKSQSKNLVQEWKMMR